MARSLNKVMIIGRVGRDPEMKFTPGGEAVANFSVATSRSWLDQSTNERREVTEWHNIVAWRRLAETCKEFLTKGRLVYIEGRLETRSWDDRETGKKMYRTEVIADEMNILEPRSDGGAGTQNRGDDFDGDGEDRGSRRPAAAPRSARPSCRHQPADPSTIRISIWTLTTPPFENMGTLPCRTQRGLRHDTRTLILESHSGRDI